MFRRLLPYGVALAAVAVVAAGLGVAAWALALPRIETFLLVFVLLAGAIAWQLGRGPAVLATATFALVSDYFFIEPQNRFGTTTLSDSVHLITGVLAAAAVFPIKESVLSVPMVTQNRLFGVLSLARLRARSLSLEDVPVMESIAAQTALALANAEQYAEAEQTIKALAMIETLQPPDGGLPDADIDQRILQGFVDLSQADLALLRRLEADKRYHVAAVGGR